MMRVQSVCVFSTVGGMSTSKAVVYKRLASKLLTSIEQTIAIQSWTIHYSFDAGSLLHEISHNVSTLEDPGFYPTPDQLNVW